MPGSPASWRDRRDSTLRWIEVTRAAVRTNDRAAVRTAFPQADAKREDLTVLSCAYTRQGVLVAPLVWAGASALCAILLAKLTGLPFGCHSAGADASAGASELGALGGTETDELAGASGTDVSAGMLGVGWPITGSGRVVAACRGADRCPNR